MYADKRGRDLKPGDFSPEFPAMRVRDVQPLGNGMVRVTLNGAYDDQHDSYLKAY